MVVIEVIARKFIENYVYFGLHDVWQWVLISAIVLATSIAIAAASWWLLESPILRAVRGAKGISEQAIKARTSELS